jgi:hypothetical protein
VKIGLIAPFEGRYREIGSDVVPAVRLAVREWAQAHPNADVTVELVTYDDRGDPVLARTQAERVLTDPAVEVIIGHWREETTLAAASIYADAGTPLVTFATSDVAAFNLAPEQSAIERFAADTFRAQAEDNLSLLVDNDLTISCSELPEGTVIGGSEWGLSQFRDIHECTDGLLFVSGFALPQDVSGYYWTADRKAQFSQAFAEGSLGAPPGLMSVAAYEAAWVALSLIVPVEGDVPVATTQFDDSGRLEHAPAYLYQWINGERLLVDSTIIESVVPPTQ